MAKLGRSPWKTRAIALAGAAAIALVAVHGVRWDAGGPQSEAERPGPTVKTASLPPPAREIPPPLAGNDSSISTEIHHLILTGTLVAADPGDSRAFLGIDPKNPQTYALNSLLVNGTRIEAIARDHVLLERNGRIARLDIGGAWSEPPPEVRRLTAVVAVSAGPSTRSEPQAATLTDGLGISPIFDANGLLAGYRLRPGRHAGVFTRWGLKPGDRLVAIEGASLTDVDSAAFMLELVGRGERLLATVLRNGVRVPVVLDGSVIVDERARSLAATEGLMEVPPG